MYEIFEKLCRQHNVTPYRVCKETGLTTATISNWKAGRYTPKNDKMQKIADFFGVNIEYLMTGKEKEKIEPKLNSKDEKDIARVLDETLEQLESDDGLMFDGEAIDPKTKELLKLSLENAIRTAKITAKKKFTPDKYKRPDNQ